MRFPIRIDPLWSAPLLVIAVRRSKAWVELSDDLLRVRFGVWQAEVPVAEVHGASRMEWPLLYGIGVRLAPRRTLGFVGSQSGVVELKLRGEHRFRVPFPIRRERLAVSVEDPDALVDAINGATSSLKGW